jgi:hypothetical protein
MKVFDKCLWSMIMVCPHTKFHIPGFNSFFSKPHQTIAKEFFFSQGCPDFMLYEVITALRKSRYVAILHFPWGWKTLLVSKISPASFEMLNV